ncbi:hypothetical protein ACHAXS_009706 [Conticribra weissflogii]
MSSHITGRYKHRTKLQVILSQASYFDTSCDFFVLYDNIFTFAARPRK